MNKIKIQNTLKSFLFSGLLLNLLIIIISIGMFVSLYPELKIRLLGDSSIGSIFSLESILRNVIIVCILLVIFFFFIYRNLKTQKAGNELSRIILLCIASLAMNYVLLISVILLLGIFDKIDPKQELFDVVFLNIVTFLLVFYAFFQNLFDQKKKDDLLSFLGKYSIKNIIREVPFLSILIVISLIPIAFIIKSGVTFDFIMIISSVIIAIYSSSVFVMQLLQLQKN